MSLSTGCFLLIQRRMRLEFGVDAPWAGLRMFELGNQSTFGNHFIRGTSKQFFLARGVEHVSMDLNGQDGALPRDIREPVDDLGQFDVVTNFGTSEHVEGQFACFQHLHTLCRPGGLMFHVVPRVGSWMDHAPYYYAIEFFEDLARLNGYEILELYPENWPGQGDLIMNCSRRIDDCPFTQDQVTFGRHITWLSNRGRAGKF